MKIKTIGDLENALRKFDRETSIHTTCGICHRGMNGGDAIKITENKGTYGYVEIGLNSMETTMEPPENLKNRDFYEQEIRKLKDTIKKKDKIISAYEEALQLIQRNLSSSNDYIKYVCNIEEEND